MKPVMTRLRARSREIMPFAIAQLVKFKMYFFFQLFQLLLPGVRQFDRDMFVKLHPTRCTYHSCASAPAPCIDVSALATASNKLTTKYRRGLNSSWHHWSICPTGMKSIFCRTYPPPPPTTKPDLIPLIRPLRPLRRWGPESVVKIATSACSPYVGKQTE